MGNKSRESEEAMQNMSESFYGHATVPLAAGLLNIFEPKLKETELALKELREKELLLQQQVHDENLALAEIQYCHQLNLLFQKIDSYQNKLAYIKKEMKSLHDKSIKLRKRSLKIQQFREKQDYIKQQKEAEIKAEKGLIGKQAT